MRKWFNTDLKERWQKKGFIGVIGCATSQWFQHNEEQSQSVPESLQPTGGLNVAVNKW